MANQKEERLLSLKSILITAIIGLIGYSLSYLPENYYERIGVTITYKWLLILIAIILLICLYSFVNYFLLFNKYRKENFNTPPAITEEGKQSNKIDPKELHKRRIEILENLASDEKNFLREYIVEDKKTVYTNIIDGTANGLLQNGILKLGASQAPYTHFPYNISEWAWGELKKNPKYLE